MFDLNFDLIMNQPQEAVWWFIPLIVMGAVGAVGGLVTIVAIVSDTEPVIGKEISVLGMQGAGKTQFLAHLSNESYKKLSASVGVETYSAFTTKIGNRKVEIGGGMDVPGGEEYIRDYYEDQIEKNEIIFFLFNTYKYLNDERYNLETRARLDFINGKIKNTRKKVVVIGTFADKFNDENERKNAFKKIQESVNNTSYSPLFKINFAIVDMKNNREEVFKFLEKMFV